MTREQPSGWDSRRQLVTFLLVMVALIGLGVVMGAVDDRVAPPSTSTPIAGTAAP